MKADPFEMFALGLRLGNIANAKTLTDDLFDDVELRDLFIGDSAQKTEKLRAWLKRLGVEWLTGTVIDAVAAEMKDRHDKFAAQQTLDAVRKRLDRLAMEMQWQNITGPERLNVVIDELNAMRIPAPPAAPIKN